MKDKCVSKYTYLKDVKVLSYENEKILIKRKKKYDIDKIYKYLDDHNVNSYLRPFKVTEDNLYFNYLDKRNLDNDEVAKHLVYALSDLQNKTTIYKEIDKDKLKEEYEEFNRKINYLEEYYFTLQDLVENKVYMAPSEYLFIRDVSIIYSALNYAKGLVESWYKIMMEKQRERYVYAHGKCELDHFIASDNDYFISLEKAHLARPAEDFIHFFKKNSSDTDMISNFRLYQHRYHYKEEEYLYLLINIVIPEKIDIYPSSLDKCVEIGEFFDKLKLTSEFVLKNEKDKKQYEKH